MENEADDPRPSPAAEDQPSSSLKDLSRKVRLALLSSQGLSADERACGVDPYNSGIRANAGIKAAGAATARRR